MQESPEVKIARIDENVKRLLHTLPTIEKLEQDSEVNKREHKFAISVVTILSTPMLFWLCKRLGIGPF